MGCACAKEAEQRKELDEIALTLRGDPGAPGLVLVETNSWNRLIQAIMARAVFFRK